MPDWSPHASRRSAQRSVPAEDIDLAFAWGCPIHQRGGRVAYHLGRREAQRALKDGVQIPERALGVAVIVANDDTVVTVVRSQERHRLMLNAGRIRGRSSRR